MNMPFVSFRPAQVMGVKEVYVSFYVLDPSNNKLKRLRVRCNNIEKTITEMLEKGVPTKYVMELAGHHSFSMTERYVHKSEAKKILSANKLMF